MKGHIRALEEDPESSIPLSIEIETGRRRMVGEQGNELLNHIHHLSKLLEDERLREAPGDSDIRLQARHRTLEVLRQLDKNRKRDLLRFLHETALIKSEDPYGNYQYPVIGLDDAELSEADLRYLDLSGDALYGTDMRGADLRYSNLSYAAMYGLSRGIDLRGGNLRNADLGSAYLKEADLRSADLTDAHMVNADLTEAELLGAMVTEEQLASCKSLEGTIMPDGMRHE